MQPQHSSNGLEETVTLCIASSQTHMQMAMLSNASLKISSGVVALQEGGVAAKNGIWLWKCTAFSLQLMPLSKFKKGSSTSILGTAAKVQAA